MAVRTTIPGNTRPYFNKIEKIKCFNENRPPKGLAV
jgi:hypothetical protein